MKINILFKVTAVTKTTLLFALFGLCSPCGASQFWSEDETTNWFIVADNVLMSIDWLQTRHIADHPEDFYESGMLQQFIGQHPNSGEVNRGYASVMVAWNAIGYFLPDYEITVLGVSFVPKQVFWVGSVAADGYQVHDNYSIGIRLDL